MKSVKALNTMEGVKAEFRTRLRMGHIELSSNYGFIINLRSSVKKGSRYEGLSTP